MRLLLALIILFLPLQAMAQESLQETSQESEINAVTYAPAGCDFTVTFPSEPYKTQRCDETDTSRCTEMMSFTEVFEMRSTVNVRVTCNPITAAVSRGYTEDVMRATLSAMTRRSAIQDYDVSFRDQGAYRQAGLVGEGRSGKLSSLYIAQLWIGENSAMTVEAEIVGEVMDASDKLFSDILKTVKFKGQDASK